MDIDANKPTAANRSSRLPTELHDLEDLIADLKQDIATKLDISGLIVNLKADVAIITSHPLFRNLKPITQHIPAT